MIEPYRAKEIMKSIKNMAHKEVVLFSKYSPDEREFIMDKIKTQTRKNGFEVETNGFSEKPETINKFRKRIL